MKLNFMRKLLSFEVLHVVIAQKLQNLEFLSMFSDFLVYFQILPFFLVINE